MSQFSFPYTQQAHPIFGEVTRPLIKLSLFSVRFQEWVSIGKVLADTGADISVVPLPVGQVLVPKVELGQPIQLGGMLSSNLMFNVQCSMFNAFVHQIRVRIENYHFEMPVAISTASTIPPIFGRQHAIDRFKVSFVYGKEFILEI